MNCKLEVAYVKRCVVCCIGGGSVSQTDGGVGVGVGGGGDGGAEEYMAC